MYSEHMLLAAEMPSCGAARRGVAAARTHTTALRLHQPSVMDQLAARASQLDHFATNTDRATALSRETARCSVSTKRRHFYYLLITWWKMMNRF